MKRSRLVVNISILLLLSCFCLSQVIAAATTDTDHQEAFRSWMHQYNKTYKNDAEFRQRYETWKTKLALIEELNRKHEGKTVYTMNQFSDLTREELARYGGGGNNSNNIRMNNGAPSRQYTIPFAQSEYNHPSTNQRRQAAAPTSYDWRKTAPAAVGPVRDQGACGSCYAFGAVGAVETCHAIRNNITVVPLSTQQIVSCDTTNLKCDGGWLDLTLNYIIEHGLAKETAYPYVSANLDVPQCKSDSALESIRYKPLNVSSYVYASSWDIAAAKQLLLHAPLYVRMDLYSDFYLYSSGIYRRSSNEWIGGHALMIVGYGYDQTTKQEYWVYKNSWGSWWGEQGYLRIAINDTSITDYYMPVCHASPSQQPTQSSSTTKTTTTTAPSKTTTPSSSTTTVKTSSSTVSPTKTTTPSSSTTTIKTSTSPSKTTTPSTTTKTSTTTTPSKTTTPSTTIKTSSSTVSPSKTTTPSTTTKPSTSTSVPQPSQTTPPQPVCTANCGGTDKCCNDFKLGSRCYSPATHECLLDDRSRYVLCGKGLGACNGTCFNTSNYSCVNGQLVPK